MYEYDMLMSCFGVIIGKKGYGYGKDSGVLWMYM